MCVFMCLCLCAYVFFCLCVCVYDGVCGNIRLCVQLRRHLPMSIFYYCVFLLLLSLGTSQTASRSIIRSKYFHPQATRVVNIQILLPTSILKKRWNWIKMNLKKWNISQAKNKEKCIEHFYRCQYCSDENENSNENENKIIWDEFSTGHLMTIDLFRS